MSANQEKGRKAIEKGNFTHKSCNVIDLKTAANNLGIDANCIKQDLVDRLQKQAELSFAERDSRSQGKKDQSRFAMEAGNYDRADAADLYNFAVENGMPDVNVLSTHLELVQYAEENYEKVHPASSGLFSPSRHKDDHEEEDLALGAKDSHHERDERHMSHTAKRRKPFGDGSPVTPEPDSHSHTTDVSRPDADWLEQHYDGAIPDLGKGHTLQDSRAEHVTASHLGSTLVSKTEGPPSANEQLFEPSDADLVYKTGEYPESYEELMERISRLQQHISDLQQYAAVWDENSGAPGALERYLASQEQSRRTNGLSQAETNRRKEKRSNSQAPLLQASREIVTASGSSRNEKTPVEADDNGHPSSPTPDKMGDRSAKTSSGEQMTEPASTGKDAASGPLQLAAEPAAIGQDHAAGSVGHSPSNTTNAAGDSGDMPGPGQDKTEAPAAPSAKAMGKRRALAEEDDTLKPTESDGNPDKKDTAGVSDSALPEKEAFDPEKTRVAFDISEDLLELAKHGDREQKRLVNQLIQDIRNERFSPIDTTLRKLRDLLSKQLETAKENVLRFKDMGGPKAKERRQQLVTKLESLCRDVDKAVTKSSQLMQEVK